jgi:putative membrane protein
MAAVWLTEPWLACRLESWLSPWPHAKTALAFGVLAFDSDLAVSPAMFAKDGDRRPARFYRVVNEVPTVLMIGIVVLVAFKPF